MFEPAARASAPAVHSASPGAAQIEPFPPMSSPGGCHRRSTDREHHRSNQSRAREHRERREGPPPVLVLDISPLEACTRSPTRSRGSPDHTATTDTSESVGIAASTKSAPAAAIQRPHERHTADQKTRDLVRPRHPGTDHPNTEGDHHDAQPDGSAPVRALHERSDPRRGPPPPRRRRRQLAAVIADADRSTQEAQSVDDVAPHARKSRTCHASARLVPDDDAAHRRCGEGEHYGIEEQRRVGVGHLPGWGARREPAGEPRKRGEDRRPAATSRTCSRARLSWRSRAGGVAPRFGSDASRAGVHRSETLRSRTTAGRWPTARARRPSRRT